MNNIFYEMSLEGFSKLMEKQSIIKTTQDDDFLEMMFKQRPEYKVENNAAYISVFGELKRNVSKLEVVMGMTGYEQILDELNRAEKDETVYGVYMLFDSPGGESIGSAEVAKRVETFSKPIIGVVSSGVCMSAAYKIMCACSYIVATESSEIGSIGTLVVLDNSKEMYNNSGIYKTIITNEGATIKGIGVDFGSLTDEQKTFMQDKVNESARKFQNIVLQNRPEVNTEVFNAGFYDANKALELGLIDDMY